MKVLIVAGRWASDIEEAAGYRDLVNLADVVVTTERDEDVLADLAKDVDVIITGAPITRKVIESAPRLRLIQTTSVGFDHIDDVAAAENGVAICNVAEANANSVAELVFGLALDLARRITLHNNAMKGGEWYRVEPERQVQIRHKTMGIIGLGAIGSRVSQIASAAFNMRVLANDPYRVSDRADQVGATLVDKETLVKESDIITVHTPLNEETRQIVGVEEFSLMKPTALFINTSRGPTVDEAALIEALQENRIAGAGLDVFETEPLPKDSPLLELDNVVLTPHIGSTPGALSHMLDEALGNVIRVVQDMEPYERRLKTPGTYYTSDRWG
jgi:D-3-phosphoglycerate dehydrogenase